MATTHEHQFGIYELGAARWLAAFGTPILLAILAVFFLLAYPHL